jgi:hypothetical protein
MRRILDGGLTIAQKRVELFAVELREEKVSPGRSHHPGNGSGRC